MHPTYIDNSPKTVCEAQISALPVIATNVGGVSSLIENDRTGLLIENNSQGIETAVKKLYEDDLLRKYISIEARKIARARHNQEMIVNQTLSMYKEIIKGTANNDL